MRIVGGRNKEIDADLLARLAVDRQSGNTVSKKEVTEAINSAVKDLKDHFEGDTSTRGLSKMTRAVANTLELAVSSGWVKSGAAKDAIETFLSGTGKGSLDKVSDDIKAEVRENARSDSSVSYGGYSSSVSYGGGSRRSSGSSRSSGTSRYAGT